MMKSQVEKLQKVAQTADLLVQDLREAYKTATGLDELLIWPMLENANKMKQASERLAKAAEGELPHE